MIECTNPNSAIYHTQLFIGIMLRDPLRQLCWQIANAILVGCQLPHQVQSDGPVFLRVQPLYRLAVGVEAERVAGFFL